MRLSKGTAQAVALLLVLLVHSKSALSLDRVLLKNGLELRGDVELQGSRITVRADGRAVYFPARQLLKSEPGVDAEIPIRLSLTQEVSTRGQRVEAVPDFLRVTPFDEFGRRTVVTRGPKNKEMPTYQAVTEIYPTHIVAEGTNRVWKQTMSLSQLPSDQLLPMLDHSIDQKSTPDILKLILFLIQAERFAEAKQRLEKSREEGIGSADQLDELREKLAVAITTRGLLLVERSLQAGQSKRANKLLAALAGTIPKDLMSRFEDAKGQIASLERQVQDAKELFASLTPNLTSLRFRLQSDHPKSEGSETKPSADERKALQDAVDEILGSLSISTVSRLTPALEYAETDIAEKLALAMSGWTLGPKLAHRDLPQAAQEWRSWEQLAEAGDTLEEVRFQELFELLKETGPDVDLLIAMMLTLPAPAAEATGDSLLHFAIDVAEVGSRKCIVLLPPEYDRYRHYPTIVSLHAQGDAPESQIERWKGLAAEHGYIVLAPEYRKAESRPYEYSVEEHTAFLATLREARRRFAIDADRVYLTGQDTGAFAAWDLGMSHPDQFAGIAPIGGAPMFYGKLYWPNLTHLPVYAVDGSLNGTVPEMNRVQFTRYFLEGLDTIYVEYPGRGREAYTEEFPKIFEWMSHLTRVVAPPTVEAVSARYSDRRFYWLRGDGFLPNATVAPELFGRSKLRAAKLSASVSVDNTIQVTPNGLTSLDILLSPRLVPLDDPQLVLRVHRKIVHQGTIEPDLETLLREFRDSGDAKNPIVKVIHAKNF